MIYVKHYNLLKKPQKSDNMVSLLSCAHKAMLSPLFTKIESSLNEDLESKIQYFV